MHSMIRKTSSALILTLGLTSAAAWGANHNVTVGFEGFSFRDATTLTNVSNIVAGDTITFTNAGGTHNVTSNPGAITTFHCSNACGTAPTGNPNGTLWVQTITFPTAGTIGYFCEQHGAPGQGMFGTINVATLPVELQSYKID